jgi:hypothetical protein
MNTVNMEESEYILKPLAQRIIKEPWCYKKQTKPYIHATMFQMDQERLMQELDVLTLKELKQIQGCGVPGAAWAHCNELIEKKKLEIELLIQEQGRKAFARVETRTEPRSDKDGESGVQTSEA